MGGNSLPYRKLVTAAAAVLSIALFAGAARAQTAVFTGKVTSAAGQPLGGASVGIPDLGVGGIADASGNYTFTIDLGGRVGRTANVVARYIGYKPKRLPLTLAAGRVQHDFSLDKDVLNLEEVVVTGTSEATSQKKTAFSVGVVDNSQIKDVPAASPIGALQGKIPGASVITTSGQPGEAPAIRLRSATSLTGRQDPLIIVDGTISRLTLADINSEDIERIEVIKGAAASSLYGSDAANGVVQIFTKRGGNLAEGQTLFSFRNEYGQNKLPHSIPGNMHHNYKLLADGKFDLTGGSRSSEPDLIADNPYPVYYDQMGLVFRPSTFMTNYVSVGQRRGATNFNASFQNTDDSGVMAVLKGYTRQNFRLNVDQAMSDKVDLGMGAFYGRSFSDQDQANDTFFGLRFLEPNIKLDSIVTTCPSGSATCYNAVIKQPPLSGNVVNPLFVLSENDKSNGRDRFMGTFKATYRPLTWLTSEANVGYDEANRNYKSFTPPNYLNSSGGKSSGGLYARNDADRNYNTSLTLTSVRQFGDMIRNTSKIAALYEDATNSYVDVNASALSIGKVPEFSAASKDATITPTSRTETIRAQNTFFVTTFDIKDRYILDGLVRRDESSLFGSKERTQVYHRVSGAWRVTEDFAIPGVDELKLRVSHGTAGLRPPFTAQYETFASSGGGIEPKLLGNENLKPAFSRETEYGFNLNFLTNYSLEYSFSQKRRTDQIIRVPLSAAAGFAEQWQNAGTLEGTTHELALGAVLLSKADYFWRVNITGDRTRQNIADLKVAPFLVGPDEGSGNTKIFRIAAGQPFGVIYGAKWIRTPAQLDETIRAGGLTGTATDYQLNEEGYYVRSTAFHTINEKPLKAWSPGRGLHAQEYRGADRRREP